ncbi:MAG: hypothetical protein ACR2L8_13405 [Solirubrobacteraceae bacterium]
MIFTRRGGADGPPLLVLLLPSALEAFGRREAAEALLKAPGALAVEPARVSYGTLGALPAAIARSIARRQAKRMKLPGTPRAVAVFDPLQLPLADALVQRHAEAELWCLAGPIDGVGDAALTLDAAADPLPAWERMEDLGIASGRLGSERGG